MKADDVQNNLTKAIADRKDDMGKLETRLMKEICELKDDVKKLDDKLDTKFELIVDRFDEKLEKFFDKADTKYASKWLEKMFWATIGIFLTTIIGIVVWGVENHLIK